MISTCKKCKRNFKKLTKEDLCAKCYQEEFGKWSMEFSDYTKNKKGELVSNQGAMKFRKKKNKK